MDASHEKGRADLLNGGSVLRTGALRPGSSRSYELIGSAEQNTEEQLD